MTIEEVEMENISHIMPFEGMLPWKKAPDTVRRKKNRKKKFYSSAGEIFSDLSQFVDDNHLSLLAKESLLRLCVFQKKDDVFMDVITINERKKIEKYYKRVITHDDRGKLVRQIQSGTGLVVDFSA